MEVKALALGAGERPCFAGVDVGLERHFPCVIDLGRRDLAYPEMALRESQCVQWLRGRSPCVVAVDAPPAINNGSVERLHGEPPRRRVAELRLFISGCYGTPARPEDLVGPRRWMASGMSLYAALAEAFEWSVDLGGSEGRLVETHPTMAFKALLGHTQQSDGRLGLDPGGLLGSKHGKVGKRNRMALLRVALRELGLDADRWVDQWTRRVDWADATMAALVACWRVRMPEALVQIGEPSEGSISLRLADWSGRLGRAGATSSEASPEAGEPSQPKESKPPPASRRGRPAAAGWLLKVEGPRAGGSSEYEMLAVLEGEIGQNGETWLPLRTRTVTVSGLAKSVDAGHCQLALCFETHVKAILDVLELRSTEAGDVPWQELTWHEDNPWFADGQVVRACPYWVRVTNLRLTDLAPKQFETGRKDGSYRPGLPQRPTPLVRWREATG